MLPPSAPGWTLAFGEIRHVRQSPVRHAFRYRAFFAAGPAEKLDGSAQGNWLFGINRPALLSFHEADHGDGRGVMIWLRGLLDDAGISQVSTVRFEGFVRVLGYAFKPVSFWHCARADGATLAIIAEVNNTFGERHCYLLSDPDGRPLRAGQILRAHKHFHVSPFFAVQGEYRFRFMSRPPRSVMRIDYLRSGATEHEAPLLATSMSGSHRPVDTASIARAFFGYPLFTIGVIARIHWHALRLVLKRVRLFGKPQAPAQAVTPGHPAQAEFTQTD